VAKAKAEPTRYQRDAVKWITAPRATTFEEYRDAIRGIRKIYYRPLGNKLRTGIRKRLDEHLDGLAALAKRDPKIATRARTVLPPSYLPKKPR
jgi:hypothetical protein